LLASIFLLFLGEPKFIDSDNYFCCWTTEFNSGPL
jgi:hypothetical protein